MPLPSGLLRASTSTTIPGSIRITPASRGSRSNLSPWRASFLGPSCISSGRSASMPAHSRACPAITVECGKVGVGTGTAHAVELIEACLSIADFPSHDMVPHDVDLFRTYAIVKAPVQVSFSFDGSPADFCFRSDIDRLNFSELAAGESIGKIGDNDARLIVLGADGFDSAEVYFDYQEGEIRLTQDVIPAMLTQDPRAIRQDCLCYLMHRIGVDGGRL
jgi:hypothetical protein